MRSREPFLILAVSISASVLIPIRGGAEDIGYVLEVSASQAKLECRKTNEGPKAPTEVIVTLRGAAADAKVSYQQRDASNKDIGDPVTLTQQPGTSDYKASLPTALVRPADLALSVSQGANSKVCAIVHVDKPDAAPAAAPAPNTPGPTDTISDEDLEASEWWGTNGRDEFRARWMPKDSLRFPKNTEFLVHGPSGAPIPPFPTSISERNGQQIVLIRDASKVTTVDIAIVNCPGKEAFRVQGTFPQEKTVQTKFRAWVAVPIGRTLGCGSGNLVYNLGVHHGDKTAATTSNVRVTEVYHLAATIFYGFDLAKQPTFTATNKKVTRTEDNVGPGMRLGFTWFPFGIDYTNMRWHNYFLNPFAAFDPTAAKESFVVGNNFTPCGGLSLAIGVSFHRFPALDGVAEGDPFLGPGEVPTRKNWNRQGVSWYIGVALDDKVYKAVKGILGQGK